MPAPGDSRLDVHMPHHAPWPAASALALLLAAAGVALDWTTWIELNVSIAFTVPLLFASAARNLRLLWGLTLGLIGATFVVYSHQVAPGAFSLHETFFIDRVMSSTTVLVIAVVLAGRIRLMSLLDAESRHLAAQNERLEAVNRELIHHKEEITRRNEELESRRLAAEEASGRKTRLLRSASHDIRTPVSAINLMAEVIRRTAENPLLAPKVPGLAQRLQANATSLAEMLSEVLDVSAFDSGHVELHPSEFGLHALMVEECNRLAPLAQAKDVRLAVERAEPEMRVRTDRAKLMRIVSNLVSNAIKFTEKGEVTMSATRSASGEVLLRVRDTGTGIAPEHLESIFREYQQAPGASAGTKEGWGLGLVICRRMAKLIGGNVTVESELGKGSVFTVTLPATAVVVPTGGPAVATPARESSPGRTPDDGHLGQAGA